MQKSELFIFLPTTISVNNIAIHRVIQNCSDLSLSLPLHSHHNVYAEKNTYWFYSFLTLSTTIPPTALHDCSLVLYNPYSIQEHELPLKRHKSNGNISQLKFSRGLILFSQCNPNSSQLPTYIIVGKMAWNDIKLILHLPPLQFHSLHFPILLITVPGIHPSPKFLFL